MLDALIRQSHDTEPGFTRKTVKWAIALTQDGRFTGVIPLGEGKGRTFECCPNLSQPELVGGGESRSHFLVEGLPTVALLWKEDLSDADQEKFRAKHKYFCDLIARASEHVSYLEPVAKLLADEPSLAEIRTQLGQQKAKPTETATVLIDGINPLERDDWHEWWREFRQSLRPANNDSRKMRCFATGEMVVPVATQPKIKGLAGVGGLGTGDSLASFDKQAFQSYGLEQSANSAMSEDAATAYSEALNALIADKSVKLGNALSVYWFLEAVEPYDDQFSWLKEPLASTQADAELRAQRLLTAIRTGQRADLSGNRYYALLVSGAAGRVMVREIMEGSFEDLAQNVARWFADFAIVARDGRETAPPPKFMAVAGALVRELKDLPMPWLQQLWRAAVTGTPLPKVSLAQALSRARIDIITNQSASHARMGLIKAFHVRKGDQHMQAYVNPEHPSPAYHCGRLLAVLARLQHAALGDVGAGVVQRYYTATSQTPGLVLGRLAANAKNHLNKLEGGLSHWYENQIADVLSRVRDNVPRTLTLEQQSLFALGYYQQLAALNAGKKGDTNNDTPNT